MYSFLQFCLLFSSVSLNRVIASPLAGTLAHNVESKTESDGVPFNITITDNLGNGAFSDFTIHHHSSKHSSELQRRSTSRAMRNCISPADQFRYSRCSARPGGSSNGVTVVCRDHRSGQNYFKSDSCYPHEICIQGNQENTVTAFCVSMGFFVNVAVQGQTKETTPKKVDMTVDAAQADGKHAIEAVVTSSNGRVLTKGASIRMAPQKKTRLHDVEVWRDVSKSASCVDCVRLDMPVVPVGTERIDVKVGLHAGVTAGKLWLVGL